MATAIRVTNLTSGWQADAYLECDKDENGHAALGTSKRMVSAWGASEAEARQKIYDIIMEES